MPAFDQIKFTVDSTECDVRFVVFIRQNVSVAKDGHGTSCLNALVDVTPVAELRVTLFAGSSMDSDHGHAPVPAVADQIVSKWSIGVNSSPHLDGERDVQQFGQRADRCRQRSAPLHQSTASSLRANMNRPIKRCSQAAALLQRKYLLVDEVDGAAKIQINEIHLRLLLKQLRALAQNVRIISANL